MTGVSKYLRGIAWVLIAVSILAVVIRLQPVSMMGLVSWTYVGASVLNLAAGVLLLRGHERSKEIAISVIVITRIATEAATVYVAGFSLAGLIIASLVPAVFVILLLNKKSTLAEAI